MHNCVRTLWNYHNYISTSMWSLICCENTHIYTCPHTHGWQGRIQCQAVVRQYLCSSAPLRAASPESPWAPSLWTAPSSALSSPAAPASPGPARCQLPLWASPTHTHTHTYEYIYREIYRKWGSMSDVGYLRAIKRSDSKPHCKYVTAVLCTAHSSGAEQKAKSWLLLLDSFLAFYHLCWCKDVFIITVKTRFININVDLQYQRFYNNNNNYLKQLIMIADVRVLGMSDPFWSKLWNTSTDRLNTLELK